MGLFLGLAEVHMQYAVCTTQDGMYGLATIRSEIHTTGDRNSRPAPCTGRLLSLRCFYRYTYIFYPQFQMPEYLTRLQLQAPFSGPHFGTGPENGVSCGKKYEIR